MNHPLTKTLLALLGSAAALAASARAASPFPTTYSQGDFLVGFRQTGNSTSVVFDLGPIASFSSPQSYLINAGSILATQYGAGWASDGTVAFSLVGTATGSKTNYVTSPAYSTGPDAGPATVWSRLTTSNATIFQNKINTFGAEFTSAGQLQLSTDANAYANFLPGGTKDAGHATAADIAWGFFNPTSEGNFEVGTGGVSLDLIQLAPGSPTLPGNDLGTFQLSGDGNTLSYTPSAVPEPSVGAALSLAALALTGFRIKQARKSSTPQEQAA